jgi:uncharacterized protein (UPF0335 family)
MIDSIREIEQNAKSAGFDLKACVELELLPVWSQTVVELGERAATKAEIVPDEVVDFSRFP